MSRAETLYLVRHGETEGNSSVRYYGRTDLALSELGRAQMRAAATQLADTRFGRIFTSPLRRAVESAELIAGGAGKIIRLPEFAEVDFGLFEGLTAEEIRQRHPEEFRRWSSGRLAPDYAYPGGESRAAFNARVERGLSRMLAAWEADGAAGCALVVAHRGVIRAIVRQLVGVEAAVELGSLQILEREDEWRPCALDFVAHLERLGA